MLKKITILLGKNNNKIYNEIYKNYLRKNIINSIIKKINLGLVYVFALIYKECWI